MKTLDEIADWAASEFPGDLCEIGAGTGNTTVNLLAIAQKYDRKVLVVDPFESGWVDMPESYGSHYTQEKFMDATEGRKDYLNLLVANSLSMEAEMFFKDTSLCFAFVDGLQFKRAVLSDLDMISHADVIVVDDINRDGELSQVPYAVEEFIELTGRKLKTIDRWGVLTK